MFETLKSILVEELQLDPNDIKMESELANDLGVNSIELADLIMLCEEQFNIEIEDEDITFDNLQTIEAIVQMLSKYDRGVDKDD